MNGEKHIKQQKPNVGSIMILNNEKKNKKPSHSNWNEDVFREHAVISRNRKGVPARR